MSWKFRFPPLIKRKRRCPGCASSLSPQEQSATVQAGGKYSLLKIHLFLKRLKHFQITEPTILLQSSFS